MRFLNVLEQARFHIISLWCALILSFLLNILLFLGWLHTQSAIKIEIPPQIPESGLTIQQGQIPKTTIYSFAYYIWQSINHWPNNGLQDYKNQIEQFAPFLTPQFRLFLIQDYNELLAQGELQDRLRLMTGIAGESYDPNNVKYIGHGTWLVHLSMHLTEMMNMNAKVVKDIQMDYTLRIVKQDVDAKDNPWGLTLDGYIQNPLRVSTKV